MSLKVLAAIIAVRQIEPGFGVSVADKRRLCRVVRHRNASRSAILIDAGFTDNTFDFVSVSQSLTKGLEDHRGNTFLRGQPC